MSANPHRRLPIDLEDLKIAFEAESAELQWYLDAETGAVILVSREYDPHEHEGITPLDIERDPDRFVRVPPAEPSHLRDDMATFTSMVRDPQLQESLELALSAPRPERRFKSALSWLPEQQTRWHEFRQMRSTERMRRWLEVHGIHAAAA